MDIFEHLCIFVCVFGSNGFYPSCKIFTVLMLVKDSEITKSKVDILHGVNLCTYFHEIWQISVG